MTERSLPASRRDLLSLLGSGAVASGIWSGSSLASNSGGCVIPTPGESTRGLGADNTYLYSVFDIDDTRKLSKIEIETGTEVSRFDLPAGNGAGVATANDPDSRLFVTSFQSSEVYELDSETGETDFLFSTPFDPGGLGYDEETQSLWITDISANNVYEYSLSGTRRSGFSVFDQTITPAGIAYFDDRVFWGDKDAPEASIYEYDPDGTQLNVEVVGQKINGIAANDDGITIPDGNGDVVFYKGGPNECPGVGSNPTAAFDATPEQPSINQPVTLDASASEAEGEIAEYRWDIFADDTIDRRGEIVEYTFEEQGDYQVTLTVENTNSSIDEVTQSLSVDVNRFESVAAAKLRVANDIDDAAIYLSELNDVRSVISGQRDALYDDELTTETAADAAQRLELGEETSYDLLINTSNNDEIEGSDDPQIAVDTTNFAISLAVSLALSQLAIVDVVADSRFGNLVPDTQILRDKLDSAISELISYTFSQARQSEALSEVNSIVQDAYDGIIKDEFNDADEFFSFVSDSISATVANLTIMQTIETGGGFAPRSKPEFTLADQFANVESGLNYLNDGLDADSLVSQGLDGTQQGALDARVGARDLLSDIASYTGTFLTELNNRIDTTGMIKSAFEIADGVLNGNLVSAIDAVTLVSTVLLPNAGLAVTAVQIIGQYIGEFAIRLMMTVHAWGIAGIIRGDPISLEDISQLAPDVDSVLQDLDAIEATWSDLG